MKTVFTISLLIFCILAVSLVSNAGQQCQRLLRQVDSYPKERLWELVQKAPDSCRSEVKKAIFEKRGVIVDDFFRR